MPDCVEKGQVRLSVVIPVFNAADSIGRIVKELDSVFDGDVQVLLIDDHSQDGSADAIATLAKEFPFVEGIFLTSNHGAGVARNIGFERVCGEYTLFFDADDILHGDVLIDALARMDADKSDVVMTPYAYLRDATVEDRSMNTNDRDIWEKALGGKTSVITTLNDCPNLLGFTNYPWNKIVRTSVMKEAGLKYGSTQVNNDILGHWYSLLSADRITLLDRILCTHIVESGGSNLTNRHERVRLELFVALGETYALLEKTPFKRARYAHHFWSFAVRTATWAYGRIGENLKPEFNAGFQELLSCIDLEDYARIRQKRAPQLADALITRSLA